MPQEANQTRSVSGAGDPSTFSMWREMGVWAHPLGFSAVNSESCHQPTLRRLFSGNHLDRPRFILPSRRWDLEP